MTVTYLHSYRKFIFWDKQVNYTVIYNDDANKSSKIRINLNIAVDKSLTLSFKGMVIWHLFPQPTPVEARLQSCIGGNPRLIIRLMERGTMRNQPWVSNDDKVADWILFKKINFKIFPCNLMKTTAMVNNNYKCMYVDHHV